MIITHKKVKKRNSENEGEGFIQLSIGCPIYIIIKHTHLQLYPLEWLL